MAEDAKAFQEEAKKFLEKVSNLQKQYNLEMYAANVVLDNGEVAPLIRIRRTKQDDNSKETNTTDKKA